MKILTLFIVVLALVLSLPVSSHLASIQPTKDQVRTTGCEYNDAVLDTLAQKTQQDEVIILIARLGTSETRKGLNQRRLHNVLVYLTAFTTKGGGRRKADEIVLAEGSSKASNGVIELYAGGKLFDTLRPPLNSDLLVGTCVPDDAKQDICGLKSDEKLYPCLDKPRRGKQKTQTRVRQIVRSATDQ
jgi:hypothetical protein